jgi:GNAT superfamily N-acetyltransferase
VRELTRTVAEEMFSDLFNPLSVPLNLEDEDWSLAWVAVSDEKIVGVTLTRDEWVSDLWVLRDNRRQGIGRRLLVQAESEIADRGHRVLRLRVVKSNVGAVQFYFRQGWRSAREFPHEKFHHPMLELFKLSQAKNP